jgi:hypothetical protein
MLKQRHLDQRARHMVCSSLWQFIPLLLIDGVPQAIVRELMNHESACLFRLPVNEAMYPTYINPSLYVIPYPSICIANYGVV